MGTGLILAWLAVSTPGQAAPIRVYVGTYTEGDSKGVYLLELDRNTGGIRAKGLVGETESPSFLAIDAAGAHLYAVNEVGSYEVVVDEKGTKQRVPAGSVSAFAINPVDGRLSFINRQSSGGAAPCHIVLDEGARHALVACYTGGNAEVLRILKDGGLFETPTALVQHEGKGAIPGRQDGPHAHSINLSPDQRFAFVADLGLDKIMIYRYDAEKGTLTPNDPPFAALEPGTGPRHFAFHPSGKYAYTNEEVTCRITAMTYDAATGALTPIQSLSTLPSGTAGPGDSTAECRVHPNGRFVYVSNRGDDSIAIFGVDESTGKLTPIGHQETGGKTPRNFNIDPSGRFLLAANQGSDNVVVFRIDEASGTLRQVGDPVAVPRPVCLRFVETVGGR